MKALVLSVVAAATMSGSVALAADMPVKARPLVAAPASPWDWAFGGALMSDYNFRGISQSNRGPSVTAYSETRYNVNSNFQFYVGSQYWAVTLPNNPTCECDFYAGIRPTLGPLAFDFGYIYYWYPRGRGHAGFPGPAAGFAEPQFANGNTTIANSNFGEVYGKVTWEVVKDRFAVGANVYYSPSWLNTGASGLYASGTAKLTLPSFQLNAGLISEVGWYVSGELGYYWIGTTRVIPLVFPVAVNLPDYATWNLGVAFTWKVATLDIRYYDTNLSRVNCNTLTSDPTAVVTAGGVASKWCSSAVIAALKFDLTAAANLK